MSTDATRPLESEANDDGSTETKTGTATAPHPFAGEIAELAPYARRGREESR